MVHWPRAAMIDGEKSEALISSALKHYLCSPVEWRRRADIHQHEAVHLPILQSLENHFPAKFALTGETLFLPDADENHLALKWGEEACLVWPVVYHPDGADRDEKGENSFHDELLESARKHISAVGD